MRNTPDHLTRSLELTRLVVGVNEPARRSEGLVDTVASSVGSNRVADLERGRVARGDDGPTFLWRRGAPVERDGVDADLAGVSCRVDC